MRKSLKWVTSGFLLVLALMYAHLYLVRYAGEGEPAAREPAHHIKIFTNDSDTYFHAEFERGVRRAEQELDVFVEIDEVNRRDPNSLSNNVHLAIFSGVDGIAFQSGDQSAVQAIHQLAEQHGVEIMLYESENHQNVSLLAAGSNSYSVGLQAGTLALEASGGECRAVVVVERAEDALPSTYQSMKIQGVMEAFSSVPGARVVEVFAIGSGLLDGEILTGTLLEVQDSYDTVICLHERTTPLIAQRMLDSGLVGSVRVVGYGALSQTLAYIERGVIYGAVCPDAYDVGYNTVALMHARLQQEQVNDYSSTRLYTITRDNVEEFDALWSGEQ